MKDDVAISRRVFGNREYLHDIARKRCFPSQASAARRALSIPRGAALRAPEPGAQAIRLAAVARLVDGIADERRRELEPGAGC
jgi:hypothetical protein